MLQATNNWIEYLRFVCDVQSVIMLRLARFTRGGPEVDREAQQMIAEKFDALLEAEAAMADAFAHSEVFAAAERAYSPLRQRVHANSQRLLGLAA